MCVMLKVLVSVWFAGLLKKIKGRQAYTAASPLID